MIERKRFAFGSQARVGKDTAVDYLLEKYGGVKFSFAESIYDIMYYAQNKCNFKVEKDREFLQMIGTWARKKNPDVWIDILVNKIKNLESSQLTELTSNNSNTSITPIYISDVRLPNEIEALKKLGFTLIKIERDERNEKNEREETKNLLLHETETALLKYDEWDYKIKNNGTLNEFYEKLDHLFI